jgi:uncharacterized phage-associated protein
MRFPTEINEEDFEELQEIIKEFLGKYRYLYEFRIQKLVYFAELYALDNYEKRLTDAKWKPYYYGCYSETISQALEALDVDSKAVTRRNRETTKYIGHYVSGGDLPSGKKAIIEHVHQRYKSVSTEELAARSKETWLYEEGTDGEPMDFDSYLEQINQIPKEQRREYDSDAPKIDIDDGWDSYEKSDDNQTTVEA